MISTFVISVSKLGSETIDKMFLLYSEYYSNTDRKLFDEDLFAKDDVILMIDNTLGDVVGFSTIRSVLTNDNVTKAIFSGDTVVRKEYWGNRNLGKAFLAYMFKRKIKRPFSPLYWILISKGYKTYLMMANNFSWYFPRYDKETPASVRNVMDDLGSTLFKEEYLREKNLVLLKKNAFVKNGIADISEELLESNPKIKFFVEKNPGYAQGDELLCLAKMTLWMPFKYGIKSLFKTKKL